MTRRYFGTDGIRGHSNTFPMTPDLAMRVGIAVGTIFRNGSHRHRVVIGKDTRLSGYMLENAMVAGFTAAGLDAFILGPIPTPAVAMLTRSLRADVGVMISASHNPYQDNGIKLFGPDGYKLSDELEMQIEDLIDKDLTQQLAKSADIGRAKRIDGVDDRYVEHAKRTLPRDVTLQGLRVVVDCANGAAYKVAPTALWEMGADVVTMGNEPNGRNINLDCGSTSPGALQKKVHEVRADIGIALDGDADRVIIVDETGAVVDGDQLMAVIAESWAAEDKLRGGGIVATVMSNLGLERFLTSKGLNLARTKVGDRYVVEHMRSHDFNVGGEQSGHIVMSDFGTTGDGLVAALQILARVKRLGIPVSELCRRFEPVPQLLKNVRFQGGKPLDDIIVQQAIADAESELAGRGRLVIRPSGTEPLIRVMAEGDDERQIHRIVNELIGVISNVRSVA
ncbi:MULTISPECIES: phosphoglucosamine mutase [Pseudorhizobium]|uniref:Phosphoglucosamine mutase n=1 Tax=Pseudorhizobium pelagicum TaxID=1509405 RepID=A0A922T7Y0_9HYPH|nr:MULTISPECIES: phosphoglucosamine mutase [Pseudorhizobium]MBU1316640.1 phosphoglucosamine mutase [Alphaproteobacteria bacterium]KEQ06537.1 phosphoglucosamine mutase [Pseudorhizobium pelagicum]KEQ09693.1 phosphoglucosamine mutase [Pseudorhizobium pelagicum]MBU1548441.1 phosphoglucosamine mutase [Alphaproteobacteria bacterium]MBU2335797.1 phosphoglucosamine mutase [Alphaproteobacteria bacterium]|tara:strand:+ start:479 stop:1831 length:1353 start_codon:yes stop_codon:yes gene_type:complete